MVKNKIEVHIPNLLYFGGDVVYGVVELNVGKELKSRGVRMLFTAFEKSNFTVQHGKYSSTYIEKHVFLMQRFDFAGVPREQRTKDTKVDHVQPGIYRWPFCIRLPDLVPASTQIPHGQITYRFSAYVDIPMAFDLKHAVDIHVGGNMIPLNAFLTANESVLTNDKGFMFGSGKLHMTVAAPNTNIFAGERFYFRLTVNNESSKNVDAIKARLSLHSMVYAEGHSHGNPHVDIEKETYELRVPHKSQNTFDLSFVVPPTAVPSVVLGEITRLTCIIYHLIIRLDVPMAADLEVDFPVFIMRKDPKTLPPPQAWPQQCVPGVFPAVVAFNAPPTLIYPQIQGYAYPPPPKQPDVQQFATAATLDEEEHSLLD